MNGIEVTVNINLNGEKVAGITTGEQAAETLPPGEVGARGNTGRRTALRRSVRSCERVRISGRFRSN